MCSTLKILKEVIHMIDLTIENQRYKALTEDEFVEYEKLKARAAKESEGLTGVWTLRKTYQYLNRSYKFMISMILSQTGQALLGDSIIKPDVAGGPYEVRIDQFLAIWDKHGAELIKAARRERRILYP